MDNDVDGRPVLRVPLAGSTHLAKIFPEDWQALIANGHSPNWLFNANTVRVRRRGNNSNLQNVSRLILNLPSSPRGATTNVRVHVKDKNPLNLRRDNLVIRAVRSGEEREEARRQADDKLSRMAWGIS